MDRQNRVLPLIAAFKIAKACLLFAVAFEFHHLANGNVRAILEEWMRIVRVDPDNKIAHGVVAKVTGLAPARLRQLGIGTFFYGTMFAVEGVGLLLKQRWAEYMTVITTTTFLPIEIYELIAKPQGKYTKAGLLLLNVVILVYLIVVLAKSRREATANAKPALEPV